MKLAPVLRHALRRVVQTAPAQSTLRHIRAGLELAHQTLWAVPKPPSSDVVPKGTTPRELFDSVPPSPWDPDPLQQLVVVHPRDVRRDEEGDRAQEILGARTLLIEIVRRAAFDWVLYRTHTRLQQRALADDAYQWLFVEEQGTVAWEERKREGKYITGFVAICEALDLNPDTLRYYIKKLTPKNVLSVGRPAEYRRLKPPRDDSEDDADEL